MAQMRWGVDGSARRPVVWFDGDLDASTAGTMVDALTKSLGDQPGVLMADLTRVRVTDPLALTSLITVSQRAAAWPACRVALIGGPDVLAVLRRMGVHRYAALATDRRDARARLAEMGPPPTVRDSFPAGLDSLAEARALVIRACAMWSLGAVSDEAQTIVSELVANAIVHARSGVDVRVSRTDRMLHIAVRDGSIAMPVRGDDSLGLLLVDAFAAQWGADRTAQGKVVWAAVRLPRTP